MTYEPAVYAHDGVETDYTVPFEYILPAHVKAHLDGEEVTFTWITTSSIRLDDAGDAGELIISRETSVEDALVTFQPTQTPYASALNLAVEQVLFAVQEEKHATAAFSGAVAAAQDAQAAAELAETHAETAETNAEAAQAAAEVAQATVEDIQADLEVRFAERRSVTDFGIVMDDPSDQSALMQTALDACAGSVLFVPAGTIYCKGLKVPFDTSIEGVEQDRSILKLPDAANTYILASATYVDNNNYSDLLGAITHLTLDGNKANQTVAAPLLIDRGFDALRRRVRFKDSKGRGVLLTALSANSTATTNGLANCAYERCFFTGNVQEHWYGEDGVSNQLADFCIVDCAFGRGNGGDGTPVYAIHAERSAGAKVCRNQIYGEGSGQLKLLLGGRLVVGFNHIDMDAQVNSAVGAAYGTHIQLAGHAHAAVVANVFHMSKATAGDPTWQHLLIVGSEVDATCALAGNTFFSNAFSMLAWTCTTNGYTEEAANTYYQCTQPSPSARHRRSLASNASGTWTIDQALAINAAVTLAASLTQSLAGGAFIGATVRGEGVTQVDTQRYSADATGPLQLLTKSRGTIASPAALAQFDELGRRSWWGRGATAFQEGARDTAFVQAATPSDTDMESDRRFFVAPAGSVTPAEILRLRWAQGVRAFPATAIPSGGAAATGYTFSSTANFGVFFGSGAPTLSAAKGSLYLRSDGSTTNDRMYVNTNGGTTWTAVTTAA